MITNLLRHATLFVLVAGMSVLLSSADSFAQGKGRGNARVMDLSLQFDEEAGKVACLGNPDTLRVGRGETLVLRAVGTFVNNVRWAEDGVLQGETGLNRGKPNMVQGNETHSGSFERGAAFAVRINPSIERGTTYTLEVKCGDIDDGPPVIIVDP